MTVCPADPYKLSVLEQNGIQNRRDIQFNSEWISNDSQIRLGIFKKPLYEIFHFSPLEFYESVIIDIENLIKSIAVDLETPYDGKASVLFSPGNFTDICGQSLFRDTEYYFNGRCFSILLPDCILK